MVRSLWESLTRRDSQEAPPLLDLLLCPGLSAPPTPSDSPSKAVNPLRAAAGCRPSELVPKHRAGKARWLGLVAKRQGSRRLTHLQPHVLGRHGDEGDFKPHQPAPGHRFSGVDVLLRRQLCPDLHCHPLGWAAIRVRQLHL